MTNSIPSLSSQTDRIVEEISADLTNRVNERGLTVAELVKRSGLSAFTVTSLMVGTKKRLNIFHVINVYRTLGLRCRFIGDVDPELEPVVIHPVVEENDLPGEPLPDCPEGCIRLSDSEGNLLSIEQLQQLVVQEGIRRGYGVTKMARQLGVGRSTLYRYFDKHAVGRNK
jgi:hypothetical protein